MRRLTTLPIAVALVLAACAPGDGDAAAPTPTPEATAEVDADPAPEPTPDDEPTPAPADEPTPAPEPDAGPDTTVEIVGFAFVPETLEISVGTTVEWVQLDASRHTVDFDDGTESGTLEEGEAYTRTFDEPGTYDYVCFFHPSMTATVVVTD